MGNNAMSKRTFPEPVATGLSEMDVQNFGEFVFDRLKLGLGFDIFEVVAKLGGRIHRLGITELNHVEKETGTINVHKDRSFDIYLPGPEELSLNATRYLIAHELGHFFLHAEKGKELAASFSGKTWADKEADWFAEGFLMPTKKFREEMEKEAVSIHELSKLFKVSEYYIQKKAKEIRNASKG